MIIRMVCAALVAALIGAAVVRSRAQQTSPNVVLILADDLGYGDVGFQGQRIVSTPNIDRLAAEGMVFRQFYAGSTVCAPSRSALLTGQHTGHTYIRGNVRMEPEGQFPLADTVFTVAELFKRAGYGTAAFGKWGLGPVGSEGDPNQQGFDRFFGYNCQSLAHRYYPAHLWNNDEKIVLDANGRLEHQQVYAPDLIQRAALRYLDTVRKDRPFFLFVPTVLPHAELVVPDDMIWRTFKGRFAETPFEGSDYGEDARATGYASQSHPRAAFAAMVTTLDRQVGQLLDKLDSLGITENTLVIFTSDNGPHREGGADPDFFNSAGGLRGYKRDLYEGGVRVPFVVRWPACVMPGGTSDHIGAFWDLMPTFAELTGKPIGMTTDGISLLPTLLNRGAQKQHAYLYWEFHEQGGKQAVRMGPWKGIRLEAARYPDRVISLYHLGNDPGEQRDVAAEYPDIVARIKRIMQEAHVETDHFPFHARNGF